MLDGSICHFRDVAFVLCLVENPVSKHCSPRSDGVRSGSELFAYDPFTGFQARMG